MSVSLVKSESHYLTRALQSPASPLSDAPAYGTPPQRLAARVEAFNASAKPEVKVSPKSLPAVATTLIEADRILRAQAGISARRVRLNLRDVFYGSTRRQHASGVVWYLIGHMEARKMAETYGLPVGVCAAILAAHSPQTRWADNVRHAWAVLAGHAVTGTIGANIRRAERVLEEAIAAWDCGATEAAMTAAAMGALGNGPKVKAFAVNLSGDLTSVVTVDIWAVRAALMPLWVRGSDASGTCEAALGRKGVYSALSLIYAVEAKRAGYAPAEFQAIVWCAISRFTFGDDIIR